MCVCVYVCICICMYVYVCICMYVYVLQTLSSNDCQTNTNTPKTGPSSKKQPVPGHPLRFSGEKVKQKESKTGAPQVIPKTVYLLDQLDEVDCVAEEEYSLTESMILIKGECDLKSTYSEDDI